MSVSAGMSCPFRPGKETSSFLQRVRRPLESYDNSAHCAEPSQKYSGVGKIVQTEPQSLDQADHQRIQSVRNGLLFAKHGEIPSSIRQSAAVGFRISERAIYNILKPLATQRQMEKPDTI